jgi:homoserine kinase type II
MAVFTDLSETECERIAAAFRLGRLTSVIGIADGDAETTFLFRADRGEFIVTLFEGAADPFDLERAFHTMETLALAGVPCPATFRTDAGAATMTVCGKLVAVVGFVPGSRSGAITPGKCSALGRCAARLHQTLATRAAASRRGLPRGVVHGALNRDNVFFLGEAVSGVINFRLRHEDLLIAELAQILLHWTARADGTLDGELTDALLSGYEEIRPLGANERRALPAFVMAATATALAQQDRVADLRASACRAFASAEAFAREVLR